MVDSGQGPGRGLVSPEYSRLYVLNGKPENLIGHRPGSKYRLGIDSQ